MLRFSGWGSEAGFRTEDDLFESFISAFTDAGGSYTYGLDWFFNGYYAMQGNDGWAQLRAPGESGKYLSEYPADGSPFFFGSMVQCNDSFCSSIRIPFLFKFRKAPSVRRISLKICRTCFIIVHPKSSHVRSMYTGSPIPPGSSPGGAVPRSEDL